MVRKKVMLFANSCWYLYNFRHPLISRLQNENYDVYCVAPRDTYTQKLERLNVSFIPLKLASDSTSATLEIRSLIDFYHICCKERPDIMLSFTPKANIYGVIVRKILRFKIIINISGFGSGATRSKFISFIYTILIRFILSKADFVFVQNNYDFKEVTERYKFSKSKVSVLPGSGVDLTEFRFVEKIPDVVKTFGMFSRLLPEKGVDLFLNSVKRFSNNNNINFVLGGPIAEGRSTVSLTQLIDLEKRANFSYLGEVEDISSELQNCDVIVLPTYYKEGTPKILIEACAVGRPVITTNIPGCNEVVLDGLNGILIEPKSQVALDDAIIKFSELSLSRYTELCQSARAHIAARYCVIDNNNLYVRKIKEWL